MTTLPDPVGRLLETIERRINELGLREPTIQRRGGSDSNTILVQLPGEGDPSAAKRVIQAGGQLELRLVEDGPATAIVLTAVVALLFVGYRFAIFMISFYTT